MRKLNRLEVRDIAHARLARRRGASVATATGAGVRACARIVHANSAKKP